MVPVKFLSRLFSTYFLIVVCFGTNYAFACDVAGAKSSVSSSQGSVNDILATWKTLSIESQSRWVTTLKNLPASAAPGPAAKARLQGADHTNLNKVAYHLLSHLQKRSDSMQIRRITNAMTISFLRAIGDNVDDQNEPYFYDVMRTLLKAEDPHLIAWATKIKEDIEQDSSSGNPIGVMFGIMKNPNPPFIQALNSMLQSMRTSKHTQITLALGALDAMEDKLTALIPPLDALPAALEKPVVDGAELARRKQQSADDRARARELKAAGRLEREREELAQQQAVVAALLVQSVPGQSMFQPAEPKTCDVEQVATMSELRSESVQAVPELQNPEQPKPTIPVEVYLAQQRVMRQELLIAKSRRYRCEDLQKYEKNADLRVPDQKVDEESYLREFEKTEKKKAREMALALSPTVAQVVTAVEPAFAAPAQVSKRIVSTVASQSLKNSVAQGSSRNPKTGKPAQVSETVVRKVVGATLASEAAKLKNRFRPQGVSKQKNNPRSRTASNRSTRVASAVIPVTHVTSTVAAVAPAPLLIGQPEEAGQQDPIDPTDSTGQFSSVIEPVPIAVSQAVITAGSAAELEEVVDLPSEQIAQQTRVRRNDPYGWGWRGPRQIMGASHEFPAVSNLANTRLPMTKFESSQNYPVAHSTTLVLPSYHEFLGAPQHGNAALVQTFREPDLPSVVGASLTRVYNSDGQPVPVFASSFTVQEPSPLIGTHRTVSESVSAGVRGAPLQRRVYNRSGRPIAIPGSVIVGVLSATNHVVGGHSSV